MHAFDFLQSYGPTALVLAAHTPCGQAFAEQLAKGGFDLLLTHPDGTDLSALKARLEDHEGVVVSTLCASEAAGGFSERVFALSGSERVGLMVCGVGAGTAVKPGSLITSLTRVFMPNMKARDKTGLILLDFSGKAQTFTATLSRELLTVDTDMLRVDISNHESSTQQIAGQLAVESIASLGDAPLLEITRIATVH
ncbi:MAG: hypothetical protein AAGI24_01230 [Pseudomonadota bacterium]